MTNYFRNTAYHPKLDLSIIMDSYGLFEKLWQYSSALVSKGFNILEVGADETFLDINIEKIDIPCDKYVLRADCAGKPTYTNVDIGGTTYQAVYVGEKGYVPKTN